MQKDLPEKQNELLNIIPENQKFKLWLYDSDLWNFYYSVLKIEGKKPRKTLVVKMLHGEICEECSIHDYQQCQRWKEIYKDAKQEIFMKNEISSSLILRWAKMLYPDKEDLIRQGSAVVYEWDLIPKEKLGIKDLDELCSRFNIFKKVSPSVFDAFADFVLGFCKLYPFGEETTEIALVVLMFLILKEGFYLPQLGMDDREFNTIIAESIEIGGAEKLADAIELGVYDRIIQIRDLALATRDNGHEFY